MASSAEPPAPPPTRTTHQRRSADRQEAMRAAAARLLIDEGPAAVTHRRVATEAGLPAGSASYYFPARAALYEEAVRAAEDVRADSAQRHAQGLARRNRAPATVAALLVETLYAPHVDADVVRIRLEPMLSATREPRLREIMRATRPRLLAALAEVLRRSGYPTVAATPDLDLIAQVIDATLLYATASGEDDAVGAAVRSAARVLELADGAPRAG